MPWPNLLNYWGLPNLQVINRDVHAVKCAIEARDRRAADHDLRVTVIEVAARRLLCGERAKHGSVIRHSRGRRILQPQAALKPGSRERGTLDSDVA